MQFLWYIFYNYCFIPVFYVVVRIGGLINSKLRRGINGRTKLFEDLIINAARLNKSRKLIWLHSSSLGEFEQAKPIIEKIKKGYDYNLLVTFFSPSGYDNSVNYPFADLISYIPLDTARNAEKFINIVHPDLAIIMRYDIWPNHIWALSKKQIPAFLVDATMNKNSLRTLPIINNFHKHLFKHFTKILTISQSDVEGFKKLGCKDEQLKVIGDTRFDRVFERSEIAKERKLIRDSILEGKKVIVAGSTWSQDEEVLFPAFNKLLKYDKDLLIIIAPHEPTVVNLERIEHTFYKTYQSIRFSMLNNYADERIIIIDSIGILLTLYVYADVAFIGGSFKQSIHNILEAAVYGIPVVFGPKINSSQEAKTLKELGGARMIFDKKDAYRVFRRLLLNDKLRNKAGEISSDYVKSHKGAADQILDEIKSAF